MDHQELMAETERALENTVARKGNRDRSVYEIDHWVMIQSQVGAN